VHSSPPVSIAEWYFAPVWRSSLPITENGDPDVPTKHRAGAMTTVMADIILKLAGDLNRDKGTVFRSS
jgi:hypothetical protein